MRISITQIEQFFDWIRGNPEPAEARRVIRKIIDQGVLVGELARKDIAKEVAALVSPKSLSLLEGLAESAFIARTTDRIASEKPFRRVAYKNFGELVESEEWDTLHETRTGFIPASSSRDEEFARVIGRTLALPESHLEVIDKFLGEKIMNSEAVVSWLFSKLEGRNVHKLVVVTKYPTEFGPRKREPVEKLLSCLDQLMVHAGFSGEVVIELHHEAPHDRYWAYRFTEGLLTFTNGHGLDAFKRERMAEPTNLFEVPTDLWVNLRLHLGAKTELEKYDPKKTLTSKIDLRVPRKWNLSLN